MSVTGYQEAVDHRLQIVEIEIWTGVARRSHGIRPSALLGTCSHRWYAGERLLAARAQAVEREFVPGHTETAGERRSVERGGRARALDVEHAVATVAVEVVVVPLACEFDAGGLFGEVHLADLAVLDEVLEVSVDGGQAEQWFPIPGQAMELLDAQGTLRALQNAHYRAALSGFSLHRPP